MKALVFHGKSDIRCESVPDPKTAPLAGWLNSVAKWRSPLRLPKS
jgi:hypothetical protein